MNNNKVYNKIFTNLMQDISNKKKLTVENVDFIESLPDDKKMEIILLYDKVLELNKKLLHELQYNNSLK